MSFIFASSHLPETRVQRPDELEDEDDDVQVVFSNADIPDDVMAKFNGE